MTLHKFIEDARRLCEEITPGPWEPVNNGTRRPNLLFNFNVESAGAATRDGDPIIVAEALKERNAEFIAASRTLLPKALEMLEEAVKALRQVSQPFQGIPNEVNCEDWKSEAVAAKIISRESLAALEAKAKGLCEERGER